MNLYEDIDPIQSKRRKGRAVCQFSREGKFIAEYPSIIKASEETGVGYANIGLVVSQRKQNRTAGGYQWRYTDECKIKK